MLGAFRGWRDLAGSSIKNGRDAKQTIAIAVKYPMRSAAIVTSSITLPQFGTMLQKQTKGCALRHTRDCGRKGIIPGPQRIAQRIAPPACVKPNAALALRRGNEGVGDGERGRFPLVPL